MRIPRRTSARGPGVSHVYKDLEPAVDHPLDLEGHVLGVHHGRQARVLHDPGVDAVAVRPRLEDDPREDHRLARLDLDGARERDAHLYIEVVADAFAVLDRAVIAPDATGLLRDLPVGRDVLLRN